MRVLITGGTGFIGSRLALRCLERGFEVRVLGQENTPAESQNRKLIEEKGAQVFFGAIDDDSLVNEALNGVQVVYHLAATQHEMNVPDQRFWDVNVEGTRRLLDTSVKCGVQRFVHGSTIGVYGKLEGTIDEQSPETPDNIYGVTKLEGEKVALSFTEKLPVAVARIPEVYGPGDRRLLKLFKAINNNKFFIIGKGENLHHLIYVEDLIDGFFTLAENDNAVGEVFLFAGERALSTNEMVATIAKQLVKKVPAFHAPLPPFMALAIILEKTLRPLGIQPPLHRRRMDFFIKGFSLSWEKARDQLAFSPKTGFAEGVEKTAVWYREQGLLSNGEKMEKDQKGFSHMLTGSDQTAKMEPFDSFWEAPEDIEKGYKTFGQFYRVNYLPHVPADKASRILVISCGPGYFVKLLRDEGYKNVLGIDCDPEKAEYAARKGLNCKAESAFSFLKSNGEPFNAIIAEQEINHLTKAEILEFTELCHKNISDGGVLIVHSLNGANPITGSEAFAQNFDHYNTFTDYSLKQVFSYSDFKDINVIPLNLYVFYNNPLNYVAILVDKINTLFFRFNFKLYGKSNKIFTKKIAAIAKK